MGFFRKLFGLTNNNEKSPKVKVQKPVKTPKKKSALTNFNEVDIIVRLEKKNDTIYAYDLNGERMYKISSTARKRAYNNGNYLGRKIYKSGTVRWVDVDGVKVKNELKKNVFKIQHLPPSGQIDPQDKNRPTDNKAKKPSVTKERPIKKKAKTNSKNSSNAFVKKLESERNEQAGKLASNNREADRYNTSQMRGTLLSLVESVRKNILLNYSVELLWRLRLSILPSATEYKNIKSYFKSEDSTLKKTIAEHKKESARYAPCLVKSQLDNVIEDQNQNRSLIKMNEVFLSKLMNDSIPNYVSTLKKKIEEDNKESTKYAPCMHKTIIDLRILISQCTLGLVEHWGESVDSNNIPQLKKTITQDEKEIAKYKSSHYQLFLEFRRSVHTSQLLECYKSKSGSTVTILKDLKLTKDKFTNESKKYEPCTHKYLLTMVAEFNDYLIKTYT